VSTSSAPLLTVVVEVVTEVMATVEVETTVLAEVDVTTGPLVAVDVIVVNVVDVNVFWVPPPILCPTKYDPTPTINATAMISPARGTAPIALLCIFAEDPLIDFDI
jgi:hypothetical protein